MGNGGLSSASSSSPLSSSRSSASSSRRITRSRQHENNAERRNHSSAAGAGYLPYYIPAAGNYPPPGYFESNGQFVINVQQPNAFARIINPDPPPPELLENHKANTIKNDVNLKRTTLRLEEDEENPGSHLVAFSFDATVAGWICIFFQAKEGQQCSLNAVKPELYAPVRIPFEKGLGQKFRQATGTGVKLSLFEERELLDEGPGEVFPLVVRTETIGSGGDVRGDERIAVNAPLPTWVQAQTTHAVLEKKDDGFLVRVVKQIIYVEGVRYELQEIYGIENTEGSVGGCGGMDGNDAGKECVICLSELRDTTVLPCRHMCMCSACAKVLRFQSNRCPICRTPVERLLEIKVSKKEEDPGRNAAIEKGGEEELQDGD